jgi:hypothetical protein
MSDRYFNFNRALVRCPDQDDNKVHVIKALLNMRERGELKSDEIAVVMKAVDYIKELESEVRRQSSSVINTIVVNNVTTIPQDQLDSAADEMRKIEVMRFESSGGFLGSRWRRMLGVL